MRKAYILNADNQSTVYTSLYRLVKDIGRKKQYSTINRRLKKADEVTIGDVTIENSVLIQNNHNY